MLRTQHVDGNFKITLLHINGKVLALARKCKGGNAPSVKSLLGTEERIRPGH